MSSGLLAASRAPAAGGGDTVAAVDLSESRDRDLLERIADGDESAFRGLFRRYAPTANSLALRVVRQAFLAEEIVQEVFLAVWRDPDKYDAKRGSVKSWLMGMVHHRAVDAVRREEAQRRRAEESIPGAVDHADDPGVVVPEEIGLPEERAAVRRALEDLPAEQRQVLELMYFEGMTQTEIADRLSLPLGTVKSRTLLGMRRLRTALVGMER